MDDFEIKKIGLLVGYKNTIKLSVKKLNSISWLSFLKKCIFWLVFFIIDATNNQIMMNKFLLLTFLSINVLGFSQKKTINSFMFEGQKIDYTQIDYSKHSVDQFYIIMYDDVSKNDNIEKSITKCLKSYDHLYHSYYFILKVNLKYNNKVTKENIFNQFAKHLLSRKLETVSENHPLKLYLNFDIDYSKTYQLETLKDEVLPKISQVFTDISSKTICKALFTKIAKKEN